MVRIGALSIKLELFILLLALVPALIQLLICFMAKKTSIRLIPGCLFLGLSGILISAVFIDGSGRALAFLQLAVYSWFPLIGCGFGWAIWWIVDWIVAYIRRSSKKQIITLFSVIASAVLIVVTAVSLFNYTYPTFYPYKDREIIGSTPEEIIEEYGEFWGVQRDDKNNLTFAKYMIRDDATDFLGNDESLWYHIYFKDGVAVKVKLQKG